MVLWAVSTHSRPKAAGFSCTGSFCSFSCFNTQPPEGGWWQVWLLPLSYTVFQHTAARRRLAHYFVGITGTFCEFQHTAARRRLECRKYCSKALLVSTHSRPKAAGYCVNNKSNSTLVSTHSRPKAAGRSTVKQGYLLKLVSTHSRPKAAGL